MTQPISMLAEAFDALLAGLDVPDEAPGLESLAGQSRRYVRAEPPCPAWCVDDLRCGPGEVLHQGATPAVWRGEDGERLSFVLDRQDDEDGVGEVHVVVLLLGPVVGAAREMVRLSLDDARDFFASGLLLVEEAAK